MSQSDCSVKFKYEKRRIKRGSFEKVKMGRHKQFKMKETGQSWSEDVKCPLYGKETKAQDVKVFGTGTGHQLLALKCGHRLFK